MQSLTTWAPFCTVVLPMWTMLSPWSKQSHGCSCQGCKATNHTGTLRNLLNPASGTYTNTRRNSPEPSGTFRDFPEPTFRNLPEPTSWTYASIHRNPPKSSGTCLRNLHHFTPELSGTFRNLPPEPAPATRTGTHRSLSGLKTPLAHAVGEKKKLKNNRFAKRHPHIIPPQRSNGLDLATTRMGSLGVHLLAQTNRCQKSWDFDFDLKTLWLYPRPVELVSATFASGSSVNPHAPWIHDLADMEKNLMSPSPFPPWRFTYNSDQSLWCLCFWHDAKQQFCSKHKYVFAVKLHSFSVYLIADTATNISFICILCTETHNTNVLWYWSWNYKDTVILYIKMHAYHIMSHHITNMCLQPSSCWARNIFASLLVTRRSFASAWPGAMVGTRLS